MNGVPSNIFPATATAAKPAIYAVPNQTGTIYSVTAALQGTAYLVGNRAFDARVNRGVFPGDSIDLYMIGLGATQNLSAFVTDRVFAGAFPIDAPITATVGGEPARVVFAGLTTPGLYLVRIGVPSTAKPGNQPIEVAVGNPGTALRTSSLLSLTIEPPPTSSDVR